MRIAIAPDVFALAATSDACRQALASLEQDKGKHCYVTTRKLKQFYGAFVGSGHYPANIGARLAQSIARHLINGTAFKQLPLDPSSQLPNSIQQMLRDCTLTDAEEHLICTAISLANSRTSADIGPSLVLFLVCSSLPSDRCLHQQQIRDHLCRHIDALEIHCAEDRRPIDRFHKEPRDLTNEKQHDARFQDQCTLWLTRKFNCAGSTGVRVLGHEIDSFGEAKVEGLRQMLIGESKLIHGDKDKVDAHHKALKQLSERIEALLQQYPLRNVTTGIQLECFLFSNTPTAYDPIVKSRAKEIEVQYHVSIRLIRVALPGGWQDDPSWNLRDEQFEDVS